MSTKHDELRRLADDLAGHRLSRRSFVRRVTALGVSAPLLAALLDVIGIGKTEAAPQPHVTSLGRQMAEEKKLVVASWGGNFGEAQRATQFDPFTKQTGIAIVLAPQSPELSLIEAQVTSGKVEWIWRRTRISEPMRWPARGCWRRSITGRWTRRSSPDSTPRSKAPPASGSFFWSSLLCYGKEFFKNGAYPASWADFWNVGKFPAPRGLTEMSFEPPPLEVAPLAKGVTPDKLYPLDIDGAFSILDEIRPNITKWLGTGADGTQLLVQGELGLATAGNGALTNAIKDGAAIGMEWNQGLLYYDAWVMPKGAPHPENAYRFIEFCARPEVQAALVKAYPVGAVVAKAYDTIPADVAASSAGAPANLAKQIKVDSAWWTTKNAGGKTNLETVYDKWAGWIIK